jgi:hypothetical protein
LNRFCTLLFLLKWQSDAILLTVFTPPGKAWCVSHLSNAGDAFYPFSRLAFGGVEAGPGDLALAGQSPPCSE